MQEALGDGYVVEANKEVSAVMGYIKEVFDLVIFFHDDAICGIGYKDKLFISSYVYRFQDLYVSKLNKVGLKYGIIYSGEDLNLYFWTKGDSVLNKISLEDAVIAIKGNQKCGKKVTA